MARRQQQQAEKAKRNKTVSTVGGRMYRFSWEAGQKYARNLALNLPIPIVVPTTGIDERDAVAIRATASERQFIGVVGGGFRHEISPRLALRVDVREHIGRNTGRTVVDATPGVAPRQSGNAIFTIGTTPPLVFSTIPAVSTLSGPRLSAFTTFEGRGVSAQLHLTAGLAWRF
jgi:hypothetical protein